MTDKAYIVGNEQREKSLLAKLEQQGCSWNDTENTPPTEWHLGRYPYAIVVKADKKLLWTFNIDVTETEIVYDGRKEEKMSDKYVVSQEFMNELEDWKLNTISGVFINDDDIEDLPYIIVSWWVEESSDKENNNRLIAIIRWLNGEDIFEVEKPKKWVVRSKDRTEQGSHLYIYLIDSNGVEDLMTAWTKDIATKFDTKEEAQSWANAHQEVVEVEE